MSTNNSSMKQLRPHLIMAYMCWYTQVNARTFVVAKWDDENFDPFLKQYCSGESIVFNITPHAVQDFRVNDGGMSFDATFGGSSHFIYIPLDLIVQIQSPDNNVKLPCGLIPELEPIEKTNEKTTSVEKKPSLKVVK